MEFHNKLGKLLLGELPQAAHQYAPLQLQLDERRLLPGDALEL